MITKQLTHPRSIVVVGGSNDTRKPGGKVLKNIIDGGYSGGLFVLNPKEDEVQGLKSYRDPSAMPDADLAVMAIAARHTPETVEYLTAHNNTRAFIILSAGFSEESEEGKGYEDRVVEAVNRVNGSLIGPNCIGIITPQHHSVFTLPIPKLDPFGCDFISGSGATACFIMEAGIPKGLTFANVYSVGNSAQMGVEEVLKYMDETFNPETDSSIKLLYLETIDKPQMLLRHASSLIRKGCRIAAIKAGSSEAGSRAASSHTGALASPDAAVDALFRKAGIVRCAGREELIAVASVFSYPELKGKNIAVITHAGGPAVMVTDALSEGGLSVPPIGGPAADELKAELFPGSSVSNPVDFLATGTASQLGTIIDYTQYKFDHIDGMVVIFGTPGLFDIHDVYDVLLDRIATTEKPIYPVLPSVLTAQKEVDYFVSQGRVYFPDEVVLGRALSKVFYASQAVSEDDPGPEIDVASIRKVINSAGEGYLHPEGVAGILDAAGIPRVKECVVDQMAQLEQAAEEVGYPLVMKVIGPVHKTDAGGVTLGIENKDKLLQEFNRMMTLRDATGVLLQPMVKGIELFAGLKREGRFGHLLLFGLGGIFIEVLKDFRTLLVPAGETEIRNELTLLKSYRMLQGTRGTSGVDLKRLSKIISWVSALAVAAPEIAELDLNPILGEGIHLQAVDARIRIDRTDLTSGEK